MPPIDDIDLEQLLNDPVVMETANRVLANPEIQRILTEIMLTMLEAPVLVPPPEILAAMEVKQTMIRKNVCSNQTQQFKKHVPAQGLVMQIHFHICITFAEVLKLIASHGLIAFFTSEIYYIPFLLCNFLLDSLTH